MRGDPIKTDAEQAKELIDDMRAGEARDLLRLAELLRNGGAEIVLSDPARDPGLAERVTPNLVSAIEWRARTIQG